MNGQVPQLLSTGLALAAVLLLILLLAWLAKRLPAFGLSRLQMKTAGGGALALRGALALDARRRLYLVEVEGRFALVLTGGATDSIVCLPPPGG